MINALTIRCWFLLSLCAFGWCTPLPAQWGHLKGRVVLDGEAPVVKPLFLKDKASKDNEVCGAADMPDESLVIDPKSKGLANIFVWLAKRPATIHPDLQQPAPDVVEFRQQGCRFVPRVLIVRTGQSIQFRNADAVFHNPHPNVSRFGLIIDPNQKFAPFTQAEKMPVSVVCDIHPWMRASWLVLDHPYAVVTDREGNFEIRNLPAGELEFKVWHEVPGSLVKDARNPKRGKLVTIEDGETTRVPEIAVPVNLVHFPR